MSHVDVDIHTLKLPAVSDEAFSDLTQISEASSQTISADAAI